MSQCKLCEQEKRLVKAHIIPEAFVRVMKEADPGPPIMVSSKKGVRSKRAPIGVYDKTIVCQDCESRFGSWDTYAAQVLINDLNSAFRPLRSGHETLAFVLNTYNYQLLKLFFISVLWRAAVSTQPFFNRVTLGPHERPARQAILDAEPGKPHTFGVVLARWMVSPARKHLTSAMTSPFDERYDGVNVFRFYFGGVIALIKVDKQPYRDPFDELVMSPGRPLCLLAREFDESKDLAAIKRIVEVNADLRPGSKRRQTSR